MINDNFYSTCPAKVSNDKSFTDYRTSDTREHYISYVNNINGDNHDQRHFLQKNAAVIMDANMAKVVRDNRCDLTSCLSKDADGSIIPNSADPICKKTILAQGLPIVHTYPTRMDPRLFEEERNKYNYFVNKFSS